jgi:hypothetical protein
MRSPQSWPKEIDLTVPNLWNAPYVFRLLDPSKANVALVSFLNYWLDQTYQEMLSLHWVMRSMLKLRNTSDGRHPK